MSIAAPITSTSRRRRCKPVAKKKVAQVRVEKGLDFSAYCRSLDNYQFLGPYPQP